MKKIIFFMIIFMPLLVLGQNKTSGVDHLPTDMELEQNLLFKSVNNSEKQVETTLIDDRNYSRSLINFDLDKSHNLSFTATNKSLSKFINNKNSDPKLLEPEPLLDFRW